MKILKLIALAFLAPICFFSCDEVENPNLEPPTPPVGSRRALIMDFTGHLCAGCPGAAVAANEIATAFPDNVFVLAVHPDVDPLTPPLAGGQEDPFTTEWRTDVGNHYQSNFNNLDNLPTGVVSGISEGGNYLQQSSSWQGTISELVFTSMPAFINLEIDYDETSRQMDIETSVEFRMNLSGSYGLVLATVENNIVDWQKNGSSSSPADPAFGGGDIDNYVHKHVLRNHINGLSGEEIVSGEAVEGETYNLSHSDILSEDFVAEEVSIYAYVFNTETLEIIDVVETHVIN